MFIQVKKLCGKFFSQVRNSYADGFDILFESPEYLTEGMAQAAAKCWVAFHAEQKEEKMPTYTLAYDPMDAPGGRRALGRSTNGKFVVTEYATKEDAWKAVQQTSYNEPVTVLEDGEPVASFYWTFAPDEPMPGRKNVVRRVRNLCKWTRAGWTPTGVQAVGIGKARFVRCA
jgi:hypothetical protein